MSRYLDLLKQIPLGKEEIPEDLLKRLDNAAVGILRNCAGQHDLTEEEREEYNISYSGDNFDVCGPTGRWNFLDKWPLRLGRLVILVDNKKPELRYLGIASGSNPYLILKCGSKNEIHEEMERLIELRETSEEEVFEDEIMFLAGDYHADRETSALGFRGESISSTPERVLAAKNRAQAREILRKETQAREIAQKEAVESAYREECKRRD